MIPRFIARVSPPAKSTPLTLLSWGKGIGYLHTFMYGAFLLYNIRATIFQSRCSLPIPYYGCILLLIALLIMVISSASIVIGIKGESEDELVPWILFTILVIVASIVLLFFIDRYEAVAVSTILGISIFSWYPIVRIYQQLHEGDEPPEVSRSHNSDVVCYPVGAYLYSTAPSPTATEQHSLTDLDADPPSYNVIRNLQRQRHSTASTCTNPPAYNVIQEVPGTNVPSNV